MNFIISFSILSFCLFQVRSDSFSEFEANIKETGQQLIKYDDQFFGSIVLSLSTLREISSQRMFKGWNATCDYKNVVSKNIKTPEQQKCIDIEKAKWTDKLDDFNSNLYRCLFDYREMGNPIRKKFQKSNEEIVEIHRELNETKQICSNESTKSVEECITLRIKNLKISFEKLSEDVKSFNIEAYTFQMKIFTESLNCNAEVLENVHKLSNQFQEKFWNCVEI